MIRRRNIGKSRVFPLAPSCVRRYFAAAIGAAVFLGAAQNRDGALAPEAIDRLEAVAKELAKAGRAAELDEVLLILREVGLSAADLDKLAPACRKEVAKVKKPLPSVPSAAKTIEKLAADLGAELTAKSDADRPALARVILRLDDRVGAAHAALGQVQADGKWLDPINRERSTRGVLIAKAVEQVQSLDVKIDVAPSHHREFADSKGKQPLVATTSGVEFHSLWPEQKLRRVVMETMRCLALINFMVTNELSIPKLPPRSYVMFDDAREFQGAVRHGAEKGLVDPLILNMIDNVDAAIFGKGEFVTLQVFEGHCEAVLVGDLVTRIAWRVGRTDIYFDDLECWPVAGLINWTTLSLLGARLPVYIVEEKKVDRSRDGRTSSLSPEQLRLRERLLVLSDAGISGGRLWMQYLVQQGEDPPLISAFRQQIGKIQGDELLKVTFAIEMLSQNGPLLPILGRLPQTASPEAAAGAFATAIGKPLADFEREWRTWFTPAVIGLVGRLAGNRDEDRPSASEEQTLVALNALRTRADPSTTPLDFDGAASAACRKHALYLAKNAGQVSRWPDAHEEYPDRPGFDPEGAWAGTHAVIASGVKSSRDAISIWMATFYHRLPLLDPNLVRIGSASENGIAVLDCASFVKPPTRLAQGSETPPKGDPTFWAVVWPPVGGTDVPARFAGEMPPPIPDVDPTTLGYPITFQLQRNYYHTRTEVDLVLHAGNGDGAVVPCYVSTPTAPTNPVLSPQFAWCLIPKAPLHSGDSYTVTGTVHVIAADELKFPIQWSFRCGR